MPHTLFLLSPAVRRGGNYCTINRVSEHLKSEGFECHLEDPKDFSSKHEFQSVVDRDNVGVMIGIHAFRTGAFMKDSSMPYILILGGTDMNVFCNDPASMEIMTEAICKARFVVCFSQTNEAKALMLWPQILPERLKVIPQAAQTNPSNLCLHSYLHSHYPDLLDDLNPSSEGNKPYVFTFIGGIRPVKNPLYLVSTFQDWHAQDKRIIYLIVGPQLDEKYTESVFEPAVNKRPGVIYIPGLHSEDAHAVMSQSFAIVNSSESEGMCLAILEAMQLGIPVLARDIPGNRSIIEDGHTGYLFDSPQTFCFKAQTLINCSNEARTNVIRNAKEYVHSYHNLEKERQAYVGLLKQCIDEIDTNDKS